MQTRKPLATVKAPNNFKPEWTLHAEVCGPINVYSYIQDFGLAEECKAQASDDVVNHQQFFDAAVPIIKLLRKRRIISNNISFVHQSIRVGDSCPTGSSLIPLNTMACFIA